MDDDHIRDSLEQWLPGRIRGTAADFPIQTREGDVLTIELNQATEGFAFAPGLLELTDLIDRVNSRFGSKVASDHHGQLEISSPTVGPGVYIRVMAAASAGASDSLALRLGLPSPAESSSVLSPVAGWSLRKRLEPPLPRIGEGGHEFADPKSPGVSWTDRRIKVVTRAKWPDANPWCDGETSSDVVLRSEPLVDEWGFFGFKIDVEEGDADGTTADQVASFRWVLSSGGPLRLRLAALHVGTPGGGTGDPASGIADIAVGLARRRKIHAAARIRALLLDEPAIGGHVHRPEAVELATGYGAAEDNLRVAVDVQRLHGAGGMTVTEIVRRLRSLEEADQEPGEPGWGTPRFGPPGLTWPPPML